MRSDNGPPFASTGAGRLSRLSVWWLKLGIQLERIEPLVYRRSPRGYPRKADQSGTGGLERGLRRRSSRLHPLAQAQALPDQRPRR
jgi:hypothetical protein